jgi:succinyl-CoA synthetase beta subunit
MNLHEYQGKQILKKFGVAVPESIVVESPEAALDAAKKIKRTTGTNSWAVKAQIHAGGRGKGGGVKIASSPEEACRFASEIIGMNLVTHQTGPEGKKVNKVLVEQGIFYPGESEVEEFYMSVLLDREKGRNIIVYSTEGGMDIETVAEKTPHLIMKEEIDPALGLQAFQARRIAFNLGLAGKAFKEMTKFVVALYRSYEKSDASLFEINPVFKTSDNLILAADAKVVLDDNALFRHPDYIEMRDVSEEDPAEVEAGKI